jgi:hypothetical protein
MIHKKPGPMPRVKFASLTKTHVISKQFFLVEANGFNYEKTLIMPVISKAKKISTSNEAMIDFKNYGLGEVFTNQLKINKLKGPYQKPTKKDLVNLISKSLAKGECPDFSNYLTTDVFTIANGEYQNKESSFIQEINEALAKDSKNNFNEIKLRGNEPGVRSPQGVRVYELIQNDQGKLAKKDKSISGISFSIGPFRPSFQCKNKLSQNRYIQKSSVRLSQSYQPEVLQIKGCESEKLCSAWITYGIGKYDCDSNRDDCGPQRPWNESDLKPESIRRKHMICKAKNDGSCPDIDDCTKETLASDAVQFYEKDITANLEIGTSKTEKPATRYSYVSNSSNAFSLGQDGSEDLGFSIIKLKNQKSATCAQPICIARAYSASAQQSDQLTFSATNYSTVACTTEQGTLNACPTAAKCRDDHHVQFFTAGKTTSGGISHSVDQAKGISTEAR